MVKDRNCQSRSKSTWLLSKKLTLIIKKKIDRLQVKGWRGAPAAGASSLQRSSSSQRPGLVGSLSWDAPGCGGWCTACQSLATPACVSQLWRARLGLGAILVKVKPDGLQQWLLGIVIQGFASRVLGLVGTKALQAPDSVLAEAYHHQEEALLPSPHQLHELWPLVPMVWQDPHVVSTTRAMIGNSNSAEAALGTIREDSRETSASTSEDTKRG